MDLERLKQLLENGSITQEEFEVMSKGIAPETNSDSETSNDVAPETKPEPELDDTIARIVQQQVDRAMAKERKEKAQEKKTNVELKKQLERLQKKMMTDEEAKQLEFEEQQKELETQRRELTLEKNKMYAVKALKKAEISDAEETIALMERLVVSCADETDIDDLVALLKDWHDKSVKAEVDKRFKTNNYTPKKAENLNNGVNPYMKDQWNYTAQNDLEYNNPELAAQLKAAAGVK